MSSTGIIGICIIYLIFISGLFVYFTGEMEINNYNPNGLSGLIINKVTELNLTNQTECEYINVINKSGTWECEEGIGYTSKDIFTNLFFMHGIDILAGREQNATYSEKMLIYNPSLKPFKIHIASEYITWYPFTLPDTITIFIDNTSMYLARTDGYTFWPTKDISGSNICNVSITDNYNFSYSWDINSGALEITEFNTGCHITWIIVGQMFNSGGTIYYGGIEVEGEGLSLQSVWDNSYIVKTSSIEKGDWLGFFMDIIGVLGWQTSPDILPYPVQAIVIGIPEACLALGVVSRLYPLGSG